MDSGAPTEVTKVAAENDDFTPIFLKIVSN
jgi:hypothetical protein